MGLLATLAIGLLAASAAGAKEVQRLGPPESPIFASTEVPAGSRIVYISGSVPDSVDPSAPAGFVQRYGDKAAQTRSALRKIEAQLKKHDMGLGDIVMMAVFLIAPPPGEHLSYVQFWQKGAALSSHAAMKALQARVQEKASTERATRRAAAA